MSLFLIAAIGLILFLLFLRNLSQANSRFLTEVLQWSSLTILSISVLLFILSGRIPHATVLVFLLVFLWLQHTWRTKRKMKLLDAPLTHKQALNLLGLKEVTHRATILQAYEEKLKTSPSKSRRETKRQIRLRHAKERLLQDFED